MSSHLRSLFVLSLALTVTPACGDESTRRPLGSRCELAAECASGLCADNRCLDPDGDEDLDGLANALEIGLGTDPLDPDSDGDERGDADELGQAFTPVDSDGDGLPDAIESATADLDRDCLVDELDPHNDVPDAASADRIAALCPAPTGVCGAPGATLAVMCFDGLDAPSCDLTAVAHHEPDETSCDARDNDCDGTVDEGCDPLVRGLVGHWRLDGDAIDSGPHGDHGVIVGATPSADRFGQPAGALRLSSPGDHVAVAATHHPRGDATATYAIWVNPDPGPGAASGIFTFGDPTRPERTSALALDGARRCATWRSHTQVVSDRVCAPAGHWSHIVVVKDGRALTLHIDGRAHGTVALDAGQDLGREPALLVGLGDGDAREPFSGAIDDLRVWDRALDPDEIERLFGEGDLVPVGDPARPARSCLHVRDAGRAPGEALPPEPPPTDTWVVDVDGDGPAAPLSVHCDMDLDGGGWTLAWVYRFTAADEFGAAVNAVTPIPSWPASEATVPVSTSPPLAPETPGAIDWALWKDLGREILIVSDLADAIACEPDVGSLADGRDGALACRTALDLSDRCQDVVPSGVAFSGSGPALYADDLYFFFDGSTATHFPTHDACGADQAIEVTDPATAGGALYLREVDRGSE